MRHRAIFVLAIFASAPLALAHGYVGDRLFPPTIATDDPFAVDELNLPTVGYFNLPGDPPTEQLTGSFELTKEIFPHFAIGVSDDFVHLKPSGQPVTQGWDNLSLSAKYQLWQSDEHEMIFSVGLEADLGGTGSTNIDDPHTTLTPTFYAGKGLGDLPDSLGAIRPIAFTSTIGVGFPIRGDDPNTLDLGLAVEYSLPYLQQNVKDIGLPEPFKNMIPLVEFSFSDPLNHGQAGQITGTINPGFLWETKFVQLGAEAVIPANSRTGSRVGAIVSVQIYIDDIFPSIFGHPVFGKD